jgi:methylisocitrate lyase
MSQTSAGARFRKALTEESPLQVIGTINANHALLAKRAGFKAIYLSGGGVAAGSLGIPDLGITGLEDVLVDVRRITDVCDTPLLVDIDTGFGSSAFNIARSVRSINKAKFRAVVQTRPKHAPPAAEVIVAQTTITTLTMRVP